jgi:hypothetical protein
VRCLWHRFGSAGLCPIYCAGSKAPEKHGGSRASALQKPRRHLAFVLPPRRRRHCSGGVPAAVFSTAMRTTRPDWSGSPLQGAVRGPPLWSAVPLAPLWVSGAVPHLLRREQSSRKARRKQSFRTPKAAPASCFCLATGADEIRFRNPLVYQRTTDNEQPTIFNLPAVGLSVRRP